MVKNSGGWVSRLEYGEDGVDADCRGTVVL
jgi:hypothetical protein